MVRVKRNYKLITFATTTSAMAMEAFCVANKLPGRLIPIPRQVSAGCGVAWRVAVEEFSLLEQGLAKAQLAYENIVDVLM